MSATPRVYVCVHVCVHVLKIGTFNVLVCTQAHMQVCIHHMCACVFVCVRMHVRSHACMLLDAWMDERMGGWMGV